jgi:hypothetical protein
MSLRKKLFTHHFVTLSEAKGLAMLALQADIGCEVLRFAQNDKQQRV